jgi:uncharacterized phage infection (PIP) family protein YhgE
MQLPPVSKRAKASLSKGKDTITVVGEDSDSDPQNKSSTSDDADQGSGSEEPANEGSDNSDNSKGEDAIDGEVPSSAGDLPISNNQLFHTEASAQDILHDIFTVLPDLHPSLPLVGDFLQHIKDMQYPQPIIPHWDANTGRFTEYDPKLEAF